MTRVTLTVEQEHLVRLAKLKVPVGAVEELIWNALDADASQVTVDVEVNAIGGVERVAIRDDGSGMPAESCSGYFQPIGRSWKRRDSPGMAGIKGSLLSICSYRQRQPATA
jgi:DNA topoisomerase VI subunit B